MSALPPEADIRKRIEHVYFVPCSDVDAPPLQGPRMRPGRASEESSGGQGRTTVEHCLFDHDDRPIHSYEGELRLTTAQAGRSDARGRSSRPIDLAQPDRQAQARRAVLGEHSGH